MEKKYQVFISSTYADLIEERKKVLDILLTADCIPAGMEAFVATDAEQFEVIKKVIDLCDYYVLIIGKRYGSIHPDTGISYTEMEYNYAISKNIPVLVFALDVSVDVSEDKKETDTSKIEKLEAFRRRAMSNRLATIWHSAEDLIGSLAVAIMKAKTEIDRPGWQRGADYDEASLRREIMSLQEKNKTLNEKIIQQEKTISEFTDQTDLAFDDCPIEIPYEYTEYHPGYGGRRIVGEKKTDLKSIFICIATEMMDTSISEYTATETIENELLDGADPSISDKHFTKRMLNQFKALSLVTSKPDEKNKFVIYWELTPKGEKVRNDSILIKQG